jgi:DNA-binding NarL/FixJ family response regulator
VIDLRTSADGTVFSLHFNPLAIDELRIQESNCGASGNVLAMCGHSMATYAIASNAGNCAFDVRVVDDERGLFSILTRETVAGIVVASNDFDNAGLDLYFSALQLQPSVKAVFLSSSFSDTQLERARQLGVDSVLSAEADWKEILAAVAAASLVQFRSVNGLVR